jgi:hypothetical protein
MALVNDARMCLGILLAQPGIDLNLCLGESLETPLMVLAGADKPDRTMLEELLKAKGIDVNARNADGDTAAMVAAAHGHEWMIERLALIPGFDANAKNARGETVADVVRPLPQLDQKTDAQVAGRPNLLSQEGQQPGPDTLGFPLPIRNLPSRNPHSNRFSGFP